MPAGAVVDVAWAETCYRAIAVALCFVELASCARFEVNCYFFHAFECDLVVALVTDWEGEENFLTGTCYRHSQTLVLTHARAFAAPPLNP